MFKIKPITLVLATLGIGLSHLAYADTASQESTTLQSLAQETAQLQAQVSSLNSQVKTLKAKLRQQDQTTSTNASASQAISHPAVSNNSTPPVVPQSQTGSALDQGDLANYFNHFGDVYEHNSVVIGPSLNEPTYYNGSELLINASDINEDIDVLNRRKLQSDAIQAAGGTPQDYQHLVLSGGLEAQATYNSPFSGPSSSNINLTRVELDTLAEINQWFNAYVAFNYDDTANSTSARAMSNSRVYIDKAFITAGDFNESPFYASAGQMFVPFGRFSTTLIDEPMTEILGKTQARALLAGFHPLGDNQPYAEAFVFKGDSNYGGNGNQIKQFGGDMGYRFNVNNVSGDAGISYLQNMADSVGMQTTGSSAGFTGFSANTATERLASGVHGLDLHGNIGYGPVTLQGEYTGTTNRFSSSNMTFNNHGAKPQATDLEGTYAFTAWTKPTTFNVVYSRSWQALGFNVPEKTYAFVAQTAIEKDTLLSLEFRHDINYGKGDTAISNNSADSSNLLAYVPSQLGKDANSIIAQIGVYF